MASLLRLAMKCLTGLKSKKGKAAVPLIAVSRYLTLHYEPQLGGDVTIAVNWNDAHGNAKTAELDCDYSITEITNVLNSGSSVRNYAKQYHGKGNIDYVCQQLIADGIMTAGYTLSDTVRI